MASIEITVEGENKEDARTSIIDEGILKFIDNAELYVSDGEEVK